MGRIACRLRVGAGSIPYAAVGLLGLLLLASGADQALAACPGPCSRESAVTGLAQAPAWVGAHSIHFEPSSPAASAYRQGAGQVFDAGAPRDLVGGLEGGEAEGPLLYHEGGGGVQHEPNVHLILWGSNFNTTTPGGEVRAMISELLEGLSDSPYGGIITQYFDSTGRVSSTAKVTPYTDESVTAPTSVNAAKVEAEVARAIAANKWTSEANAQFMVLTAPGSTYERAFGTEFCAYHGVTSAGAIYSFIPYQGDPPFSTNGCLNVDQQHNPVHKTSKSASHEYAEAATDPRLDTWYSSGGEEVADICQSEIDLQLPDGAWVQNLYDDHLNACVHEDALPPEVYAITESAANVTSTGATLRGIVNPESLKATYRFEYGTSTTYGASAPVAAATVQAGVTNQAASQAITGLKPETTYHYRLLATNSSGTTAGRDRTLRTQRQRR
ncbi:MAG: hypothetical protein ACLQMH_03845 [Solirubrobacteraceae bacterium]